MNTNIITSDICNIILQKKLKTKNYELIKYSVDKIEQKIGFLGEYYKLETDIKYKNQEDKFNFFVKLVPQTGFSGFVITSGSFDNETFMYNEIFEKMMEKGIQIENCIGKYFYSRKNEMIIFEDLNTVNYQVADKHKQFEFKEISIVLKKLAEFHACSFLLDEKLGGVIENSSENLRETNYVKIDKHLGYEAVKSAVKGCLKMVDYFPSSSSKITNEELKKMVLSFYNKIMYEQCSPSNKYRNVFCHGDLWANNIMLKYDQDTNKLIDCRFVDFQNTRICPPAHDVLSLIYLTTTRELRQKHFINLLHIYHNELSAILKRHSCQPNKIIPLSEFLQCCEEFKIFAVNFAVTMFPIVSLRSEEMEKLFIDKKLTEQVMFIDRGDFISEVCSRDVRYRTLLMDSMKDLRELCEELKNKI